MSRASSIVNVEWLSRITRQRHGAVIFAAILLVAAALRLWNYDFDALEGDKPLYHDAWAKFVMASDVAQGRYQPAHYKQPGFLIYSSGMILRLSALLGQTDKDHLWRLVVLYMITCSVLTVGVTYLIAQAVFGRQGLSLLAMAFAAVLPAGVTGARYIKEDVPLALFVSLSILFLVLAVRRGVAGVAPHPGHLPEGEGGERVHSGSRRVAGRSRLRWYLPAGICIGLAVATKYAAVGMVAFFVVAHCFVVIRSESGKRLVTAVSPWFLAGLLAVPLVFLVFNPYVVQNWSEFRGTLSAQALYAAHGHNDGTSIQGYQYGWMFYLLHALIPGMTLPLMLAATAGMVRAVRERAVGGMFLMAWAVFFYLNIENSPAKPFPFFARYAHALFPVLCVFASYLLCTVMDRCALHRMGRRLAVVAVVACVLTPLLKSSLVTYAVGNDTRPAATRWIDANLESGARIYLDDVFYSPRPAKDRFDVQYRRRMYYASLETLRRRKVDYVVLNSFRTDRYEACGRFSDEAARIRDYYRALSGVGVLVREFKPRFACQTYGFHNPVVGVYRMPWASGQSSVKE